MVKILYFASLRERMGRTGEDLALPPGAATVADLITHLTARDPAGSAAFAHPGLVRAAVNQEFAPPSAPISDGDEIAFFPPVTGG
jgi:sulfur-carrier protein